VARGHEVHVVLMQGGAHLETIERGGVTVHTLPRRGGHDPRLALAMARLIRRLRPDVVQTWLVQMDVWGGLAALLCRVPWILSERSSAPAYPGTKIRARRWLGRWAAAVVANSRAGLAYWNGTGAGRLRAVIGNAIDFAELSAAKPCVDIPAGMRLILFAGRLSSEKNLQTIFAAVAPLLAERKDVMFAICGEGPLEDEVRRLAAATGAGDRIRIEGFVPGIWSWMKRADVLISLSQFEGNPNAVVEAMAIGCPVVLSDIAPHRELASPSTAALVGISSPREAEQALRATLDDPEAARKRADNAKHSVAGRSVAAVAEQYVAIYESL
jgi:glycosyltransferase involved in cell wall biosynthesis